MQAGFEVLLLKGDGKLQDMRRYQHVGCWKRDFAESAIISPLHTYRDGMKRTASREHTGSAAARKLTLSKAVLPVGSFRASLSLNY